MTILTDVWRFQCDPNGVADPMVEVFLKQTTVVDGKTFVDQSTTPIKIPFSEFIKDQSGGLDTAAVAAKADAVVKAEAAKAEPADAQVAQPGG